MATPEMVEFIAVDSLTVLGLFLPCYWKLDVFAANLRRRAQKPFRHNIEFPFHVAPSIRLSLEFFYSPHSSNVCPFERRRHKCLALFATDLAQQVRPRNSCF